MIPVNRHEVWKSRAGWLTVILALFSSFLLVHARWWRLPGAMPPIMDSAESSDAQQPVLSWPIPSERIGQVDWSLLSAPDVESPVTEGRIAPIRKLFRLAGTFFYEGTDQDDRKAILDDLRTATQVVVGEGDDIGAYTVRNIHRDNVVLTSVGGDEEQLWLSFSRSGGGGGSSGHGAASGPGSDGASGPAARFGGRQVGEYRWVFEKQALLDYYAELRDEPDRLVRIFDSMKPIYDDRRKITGYVLDIEGEGPFFESVGLKQDDVVRSVNSMKMTSRRRAEHFIKEFVADRANVFRFDVERDGEPIQLRYEVR